MKKLIYLLFLITQSFYINAQSGILNNYWPNNPQIGDTLYLEVIANFPIVNINGPTCGVFIKDSTFITNNTLRISLFYDVCIVGGPPPNGCYRTDTIAYYFNQSNVSNAKIFYNFKGTICTPFPNRVIDSTTIIFNSTSIQEQRTIKNLIIQPNPIQNQFRIKNSKTADFEIIQFWNLQGQLVKETQYSLATVDISDLSSGIYILRLIGEDRMEQVKVVKE